MRAGTEEHEAGLGAPARYVDHRRAQIRAGMEPPRVACGRTGPSGPILSTTGQEPIHGERRATDREHRSPAAGPDEQLAPRRTPKIFSAYHV
jgi:hypothetical protein